MSRSSVLARGRAAAEAGMVDMCTITRATGRSTNTTTGAVTDTTSTLYTGKCRVQQHQATATGEDVAEDRLLLLRVEVQLPMSVTGLAAGDVVTVTASVHDEDLVDRVFRIHDLAHKTHATARRVQAIERTGS
jgi:hypothetical protein